MTNRSGTRRKNVRIRIDSIVIGINGLEEIDIHLPKMDEDGLKQRIPCDAAVQLAHQKGSRLRGVCG